MGSEVGPALRSEVIQRAKHRCEYCLLHEADAGFSHQVDHVVSRKHGGDSTMDNLAYACVLCNRYKGLTSGPWILIRGSLCPFSIHDGNDGRVTSASKVR